jgi:myxalamid-type polyketide synthase MxaD
LLQFVEIEVMLDSYSYRDDAPLDIPISVFGSRQDRIMPATGLGNWRDQTRAAFSVRMFDGDHFFPRVEGEALLTLVREQLGVLQKPAEQPREIAR